jgi:hypothetical protein
MRPVEILFGWRNRADGLWGWFRSWSLTGNPLVPMCRGDYRYPSTSSFHSLANRKIPLRMTVGVLLFGLVFF